MGDVYRWRDPFVTDITLAAEIAIDLQKTFPNHDITVENVSRQVGCLSKAVATITVRRPWWRF